MNDPLAVIAELPGVPEAVQEAREAVDRLYRHPVLRRRSPEVSAESALRGARASAAIEGVDVPLEELRRGEVTDPVVQGALRASTEIGRLTSLWRSAPPQVLARLHAVAAVGLTDDPGRPRSTPTDADPLGLGPAPGPEETAARLSMLTRLLTGDTKAPALVLAAIVHAELVTLRPFGVADGLVARAAARFTLVERGLDPKSLCAVEVGHAELGDAYPEALRSYQTGTPAGLAGWIRHCADAVVLGVRETTAICEALSR
ncbi:Fic family protein [Thermobispora bispora]|uniref:Filamentation induced by cAMP protein Fic n=1 Tax=Thermobispora bispora (strain ATCC 19993 / DSM 43833 / CBS 139.67 / JCM 10125 / KCTC 9307 / NBRC 14880 / R51) TaxID=469371 RepID=D6Y2Y3_THEBD|nr:Fic family protein [Thermobispora bispora]ADG86944.1 filamentation induced by cAMP protein Fic [Thermobispora bispora DSM 43833]